MTLKQFYYKKNRIQQLRGFYYAAQMGSFSLAAKKMSLTQAAVSLQIQSLERDLKAKVFIRNKNKITLTDIGQDLYLQASIYIQGIDNIFENLIDGVKNKNLNTINIAANHVVISYILPKYIKKFKTLNPEINFQIRNLSKSECLTRLMDDKIDAFIYPMNFDEIPNECDFIPIVNYQPILLTKKNHILSKKKKVNLKDVAKFELVRIDPHLITLPNFEKIIKINNLKTKIEFEMSDWEILKKFVAADIGVAIISNIILEGEKSLNLTGTLLTDYFPEMTYGIIKKRGKVLQKSAKEFIDFLTNEKLLNGQK